MKPHPEWRGRATRPLPAQSSIQFSMCHRHQRWHPRGAAHLQPVIPLAATFTTIPHQSLDLLLIDPVSQEITRPSLHVVIDKTSRLILSTFLVVNTKSQEQHSTWGGEQSC
ncbi:hypothetical protein [Aquitalea magnusonii]|uniref:hypothetical protein n=1 Tax=Aquitalea magnusonii TaxID=332411 RepID=UPI0011B4FDD1|nr:hypothetical protein [Aquitalea magnusonii]